MDIYDIPVTGNLEPNLIASETIKTAWHSVLDHLERRLRNDEQGEPEREDNRTGFRLPRLNDLFPEALFPPVEALRRDWEGIFFWVYSEYEPSFYPGKSTFFFTRDKQRERGRRRME